MRMPSNPGSKKSTLWLLASCIVSGLTINHQSLKLTHLGLGLIGRPDTHSHTSVNKGKILNTSQSPGKGCCQSAHIFRPQTARTGALKGIKTIKSSAIVAISLCLDDCRLSKAHREYERLTAGSSIIKVASRTRSSITKAI